MNKIIQALEEFLQQEYDAMTPEEQAAKDKERADWKKHLEEQECKASIPRPKLPPLDPTLWESYAGHWKGGRCRTGSDQQGRLIHAILKDPNYESGTRWETSLCGSEPQGSSAGWSSSSDDNINCPKCIRKFEKIQKKGAA